MKSEQSPRPYRMVARADAAEETAQRILEAAYRLFTDLPYDDVSLETVAENADVTKRTILRRYGSKEQLFGESMQMAVDDMVAHRESAPVDDPAAAVNNVISQYERWGDNRLRLLAQEDRIPLVAEWVRGGRAYHWEWVERVFADLLSNLGESDRTARKAALVALTDVYTWKLLRRDLGLSQSETERALLNLILPMKGHST